MDTLNPFYESFGTLEDPRKTNHSSRHLLMDILILTILAVICGADGWVAVEKFGHAKYDFLKRFLDLPYGIPSHDTIGDLFSRINPETFQHCFLTWVNLMFELSQGEIIAVDGKTNRHTYDTRLGKNAIHMVSAWACANRLVLGQVKTEEKSNEITAIPELLKLLDLNGMIVTIDAMGCQKKIAKQIVDQGGKYLFNLKGNQSQLHEDIALYFQSLRAGEIEDKSCDYWETIDGEHGRIETRRYYVTNSIDWLTQKSDWSGLTRIGLIEYEQVNQLTNERKVECRYFISALEAKAEGFAKTARAHWGIENELHWCLDVAFSEDDSRVRKDHAPTNLAVIRHLAINLLKQESTARVGIKNKRLMAGWDDRYLAKVLMAGRNV